MIQYICTTHIVSNDTLKIADFPLFFNCYKILSNTLKVLIIRYFKKVNYFTIFIMFNANYLPDRIDLLLDTDSIAMEEFLYIESLKKNNSFINRVINKVFKKGV